MIKQIDARLRGKSLTEWRYRDFGSLVSLSNYSTVGNLMGAGGNLWLEGGFARMHQFVSETAKYGDLTRGPRIVDDHVRAEMKKILEEIRDGSFAEEWIAENRAGRPRFNELRARGQEHQIEKVGADLRAMMPWISAGKARPQDVSGGSGG